MHEQASRLLAAMLRHVSKDDIARAKDDRIIITVPRAAALAACDWELNHWPDIERLQTQRIAA